MAVHQSQAAQNEEKEAISVTHFRQYLRIKTVQPDPDYAAATVFLKKLGSELGLTSSVVELVQGKPVFILSWRGSDPALKSLVLNSHIDVVPVFPDLWTQDPWAADKINGRIYGRGAQDMKCVGIQYLEAIRKLQATGYAPSRTIHVMFVPDEEIGGHDGMKKFVLTDHWRNLNPGLLLDEGLGNPEDSYKVYYGERAPWWIKVIVKGETGHGSQFIENTVGPKLQRILAKFMNFRAEQEKLLKTGKKQDNQPLDIGDVTTCNMTLIQGGVQFNVIPNQAQVGFDIRISPSTNLGELRKTIDSWCQAEDGVTYEFEQYTASIFLTKLENNPWWEAMQAAAKDQNVTLVPTVFPASTDSRYVRESNVPALGVSPMRNTPVLLHCHDEYLDEHMFLEGVEWYAKLIPRLDKVTGNHAEEPEHWIHKC